MGRVIALDVGTKTIGVAVTDPLRIVISPVTTLSRQGVKKDAATVAFVIERQGEVDQVVVGMPYELDGSEERSARLARQVGEAVAEITALPVAYVDERYSSVEAEERLIQANVSRQRRKEIIDQEAAAVILRRYLEEGP